MRGSPMLVGSTPIYSPAGSGETSHCARVTAPPSPMHRQDLLRAHSLTLSSVHSRMLTPQTSAPVARRRQGHCPEWSPSPSRDRTCPPAPPRGAASPGSHSCHSSCEHKGATQLCLKAFCFSRPCFFVPFGCQWLSIIGSASLFLL